MEYHCGLLELNKVTPPLHAAVPSMHDLMDQLTVRLGQYHYAVDLTNAFFSIDVATESLPSPGMAGSGLFMFFHKDTCTAPLFVIDLSPRTWLPEFIVIQCLYFTTLMLC